MKYAVSFISVLLSACASSPYQTISSAADRDRLEVEACANRGCEFDVHVQLLQKNGKTYDKVFDWLPIVQGNGVMVVAGQTVYFEADVVKNQLINFKLVHTITHPDKTVTATLEQSKDGGMLLSLHNPFAQNMRIKMAMMPLASETIYKTSSCPVIAGGGSFESWPYPIFQIWLGEPRLMETTEDMSCRE